MDLITFLFPQSRAAQAAKEAADQLAEHKQTERLKALAAMLQLPLDKQTRMQAEAIFQTELAKIRREQEAEAFREGRLSIQWRFGMIVTICCIVVFICYCSAQHG
jgi:hypothetical protein